MRQLQLINLQVVKAYKHQKYPIISICLDHQEGNERLYFGTCEEPSNRLVSFHDLNLFVNKAFYFVHRNTQEIYQGLIPIMYFAFYRNQYTNMIFFGPPGISEFIVRTRYILGIRNLAFGALDLQQNMNTANQKFGIGNKSQFIEGIKYIQNTSIYTTLQTLNEYIQIKIGGNYVIPKNLLYKQYVCCSYAKVLPLFQNNQNLLQYLVLFKKETQFNYEHIREMGIPLSRIPDIKEGQYFKDGKQIKIEQVQKINAQLLYQGILLLDFQEIKEVQNFIKQSICILGNELNEYKQQFKQHYSNQEQSLIIIHYAKSQILESEIYQELLQQLQNFNYKLVNIIVSQEYYQNLDKQSETELGREQQGYYYLDYLKQMRQNLPKLFQGQDQFNQFKISQDTKNLSSLWTQQLKYLPMKMKTIQIKEGNIYFENISLKRSITYALKNELKQHLTRLNNLITYNKQEFEIIFLGTASSIETQSRSASSLVINLKNTSILLDCGQNSLNQFYFSCLNEEDYEQKITNIKLIYISHPHNDHNQGLYDFVKQKCKISKEQFFILIPKPLFIWYDELFRKLFLEEFQLKSYQDTIKFVFTDALVNNDNIQNFSSQNLNDNLEPETFPSFNYDSKFEKFMNQQLFLNFMKNQNIDIQIEWTQHCQYSSAIKVKQNGKSLVYSSDRLGQTNKGATNFLKLTKNCDVLIHECTYPDNMITKAINVKHSTFLQALLIGYTNQIPNLILTHFTERSLFYLKSFIEQDGIIDKIALKKALMQANINENYKIDELINYFENNVILATDFMHISNNQNSFVSQISRVILKSLIP